MKMIILTILLALQAQASFENTSYRYLMPSDFITKLLSLFPNADRIQRLELNGKFNNSSAIGNVCVRLSEPKCYVYLGRSSPFRGEPQTTTPDMTTVKFLSGCGRSIIEAELNLLRDTPNLVSSIEGDISTDSELARDTVNRIFPVYKKRYAQNPNDFYRALSSYAVANDPELFQHTVSLVHMMLGPDQVIAEYGQAKNAEEIATEYITAKIKQQKMESLRDYTVWVLTNLIIREEFLAY